MAGGQRLISWLHPYSTSNVALNTRTCAHGPLMGHPNWAGCDTCVSSYVECNLAITQVISITSSFQGMPSVLQLLQSHPKNFIKINM
jgi:hypothetical protein